MDQRKIILRVVKNRWKSRKCKHGETGVGLTWLTMLDNVRYEFCYKCLEDLFEFQPQMARIMRKEHMCECCREEKLGVLAENILTSYKKFVCLDCMKRYADDR